MPTSEARIHANQQNAARSTGPKTPEGKERSRANALKHGLTGAGVVSSVEDQAEVDRLQRSFEAELRPTGDLGRTLVHRMALMTVRMDRCVQHESASLADRIANALADFDAEWPESGGVDDPDRDRLRAECASRALFDPSKEATLARKYEAAAERCFFRSMKELRVVERQAKATGHVPAVAPPAPALGSFSPAATKPATPPAPAVEPARKVAAAPARVPQPAPKARFKALPGLPMDFGDPFSGSFDVPFAIGRVG